MSLHHEFLLLAVADHAPKDYLQLIKHPSAIHIHDDLLRSIAASLETIPTLNPATGHMGHGLNLYGPTAILAGGALIAEQVFRAAANRFGLSPEGLVMERVANVCQRAASSGGTHFVLHLGI